MSPSISRATGQVADEDPETTRHHHHHPRCWRSGRGGEGQKEPRRPRAAASRGARPTVVRSSRETSILPSADCMRSRSSFAGRCADCTFVLRADHLRDPGDIEPRPRLRLAGLDFRRDDVSSRPTHCSLPGFTADELKYLTFSTKRLDTGVTDDRGHLPARRPAAGNKLFPRRWRRRRARVLQRFRRNPYDHPPGPHRLRGAVVKVLHPALRTAFLWDEFERPVRAVLALDAADLEIETVAKAGPTAPALHAAPLHALWACRPWR